MMHRWGNSLIILICAERRGESFHQYPRAYIASDSRTRVGRQSERAASRELIAEVLRVLWCLIRFQRDNALKEMRAKVHLLESTLAKHLTAPVSVFVFMMPEMRLSS